MDNEYLMEAMQRSKGRSYREYEERKRIYDATGDQRYYDDPMERMAAGARDSAEKMFGRR